MLNKSVYKISILRFFVLLRRCKSLIKWALFNLIITPVYFYLHWCFKWPLLVMPFLLSTLLFYRLDCLLGFYIYSFIFIIVSYDFIKKKNINKLFVVLLFFISILFNYIHFYIYPGSLNILLNFCFVSTLYFFLITKKFILSTSPDFKLVLENVKKDFILSINKYDNFIAANILANEKNTLKKIVKKKK